MFAHSAFEREVRSLQGAITHDLSFGDGWRLGAVEFRIGNDVGNVDGTAFNQRAAENRSAIRLRRVVFEMVTLLASCLRAHRRLSGARRRR
jgi:hypothetical protein